MTKNHAFNGLIPTPQNRRKSVRALSLGARMIAA